MSQKPKAVAGSGQSRGFLHGLLLDPTFPVVPFWAFSAAVLLAELVFGIVIIQKVPYTEIDWIAYMQEVSGFLGGELDYMNLKGDTGPLVYPAGFVYLYSFFYWITNQGANILLGQYLFLGFYLLHHALLFMIFRKTGVVPPIVYLLLCLSKRIHSIFMLRLFNDCHAVIFLYIAVILLIYNRWTIGCIFFSLAISIKMNILLYAPALGVLMVQRFGLLRTIPRILLILAVQAALGAPFLLTFPKSYFGRAFEFGRQFMYKWTVNFKFLSEENFLSPKLALGLLGGHLLLLVLFAHFKWTWAQGGIFGTLLRHWRKPVPSALPNLTAEHIVTFLFTSNFIGFICCRSMHYQFYVWYFGTIPYLLWRTRLSFGIRILIFLLIEVVWNVYPARPETSLLLHACHLVLLAGLWLSPDTKMKEEWTPAPKKAHAQ